MFKKIFFYFKIQNLLEDAYKEINNWNPKKAISIYEDILKIDKTNMSALINLWIAYGGQKDFENSIKYYDKALSIENDNLKLLFSKGATLRSLGKFKEALTVYDSILKNNPEDEKTLINKWATLIDMNKGKEAEKVFKKCEELFPDNLKVIVWIWTAYFTSKDYESALEYYEKIYKSNPKFPWILHFIMECYKEMYAKKKLQKKNWESIKNAIVLEEFKAFNKAVEAEYFYLSNIYFKKEWWQILQQKLIKEGNEKYDLLTVKSPKWETKELYFLITYHFNKRMEMIQKHGFK